jgi:hypothetical protein
MSVCLFTKQLLHVVCIQTVRCNPSVGRLAVCESYRVIFFFLSELIPEAASYGGAKSVIPKSHYFSERRFCERKVEISC